MIKTLEEIGAISRKNMYKIACGSSCEKKISAPLNLQMTP